MGRPTDIGVQERLMKLARRVHTGVQLRVQPVPSSFGTQVFEIHKRPNSINNREDMEWVLLETGESEHLMRSLKSKLKGLD